MSYKYVETKVQTNEEPMNVFVSHRLKQQNHIKTLIKKIELSMSKIHL